MASFKTSIFLYVYVVHILNSIHLSFLKQQYCYCKLGNIMHGPIYLTVYSKQRRSDLILDGWTAAGALGTLC